MAKTYQNSIATHPGLASVKGAERALRTNDEAGQDAYMPANIVSLGVNTITLADLNYVNFYNPDWYTETKDGTATIAPNAAGILIVNGNTAGNDAFVLSKRANTIVAGKVHTAIARVSLEDVDQDGLWFGFWTAGDAEIAQAEPVDGIYFESPANAGTLIGTVRTASGTSVDTGTLATLADNTFIEIAVQFACGTTAADSWGKWWVNGVATDFTAAQLTALGVAGAAANASLAAGIGSSANDTGADDFVIQYGWAGVDR